MYSIYFKIMVLYLTPRRRRQVIKLVFLTLIFTSVTWWIISNSVLRSSDSEFFRFAEEADPKQFFQNGLEWLSRKKVKVKYEGEESVQQKSFPKPKTATGKFQLGLDKHFSVSLFQIHVKYFFLLNKIKCKIRYPFFNSLA